MSSQEARFDQIGTPRPMGWFRLDVVLTAVSEIFVIDWDSEYWGMHPSRQPFQHEVGDMLSYLALDGQLEVFQLGRVADDVTPGILEQLKEHPELKGLIDSIPAEDAPPEETIAWYERVIREHPMDRLIELSPVVMEAHARNVDPAIEFELMGGTALRLPLEDE